MMQAHVFTNPNVTKNFCFKPQMLNHGQITAFSSTGHAQHAKLVIWVNKKNAYTDVGVFFILA